MLFRLPFCAHAAAVDSAAFFAAPLLLIIDFLHCAPTCRHYFAAAMLRCLFICAFSARDGQPTVTDIEMPPRRYFTAAILRHDMHDITILFFFSTTLLPRFSRYSFHYYLI